jgi:pyridoxal phosphate enzyme (YggS family)
MNPTVERLAAVKARIAEAEKMAGRAPGSVTLIAVTKTFDADAIRPLLEAGHRAFGENRVQESARKWPALRPQFPETTVDLIGPLQSNKVREAVELFYAIHTVDRDKIAEAIAREIVRQKKTPLLFVEVNTGGESQKAGIPPQETDAFVTRCREVHGLHIDGLMCIPPVNDVPAPHFALLAKIAKRLDLESLSMGMSGDFETAIALGATHVRVGSAILGERQAVAGDDRAA